jgi:hypothetical protein
MDGIARLVIQDCPLDSTQATTLTQAILARLVHDQFHAIDFSPPIVLLEVPRESPDPNAYGYEKVQIHYTPFDFGSGVRLCWVWASYGGVWRFDSGDAAFPLARGTIFKVAVRCEDNAGILSPWNISGEYSA